MRVALVHDWLNGMRGGEKVLEAVAEIFPDAEIFTLLCDPSRLSPELRKRKIHTSFVQRLPGRQRHYRLYLPLFPRAIERFDLRGFDLVISTSHAVAKGVIPPPGTPHLCYCFTPMRYAWFLPEDYFGRNPVKRVLLAPFLAYLRRWDRRSSERVSRFLAISRTVARRIERAYERPAEVLYPPVDDEFYSPGDNRGEYFLVVSALVPYKRVDLAIAAFNRLKLPLLIVGSGPEQERLARLAGDGVELLGWRSDAEIRRLYRGCRALVFPGIEDFGIVPLEAMACGRPVIGLGRGGLTETVIPPENSEGEKPTGLFFREQTPDALTEAVREFIARERQFDPRAARERAEAFGRNRFLASFREAVSDLV